MAEEKKNIKKLVPEEQKKSEKKIEEKAITSQVDMSYTKIPHIQFSHVKPHPIHMNKTSIQGIAHSFLRVLNPAPPIGGLDISSSRVAFVRIIDGTLIQSSVILPPGIIVDGKIKDRTAFIGALKKLHHDIAKSRESVQVIMSLPSPNIYTEVFTLPYLSSEKLHDAARLNLQMISPIDITRAYYDAESISDVNKGGQIEFLGAFADMEIVEEYSSALLDAQFSIVAIEFPALALARLIRELGTSRDASSDSFFVGLFIHDEGLQFFLLKNNMLYFQYFAPFQIPEEGKRVMSADMVRETLITETQKVMNFASSHWSVTPIAGYLFIAPPGTDDIEKILTEHFSLPVQKVLLSRFTETPSIFFPALGSALRGIVSRRHDSAISLTAIGTERGYEEHRMIYFANVWRNIIVSFVIFFAFVYGIAYGLVVGYANEENERLVASDSTEIRREIAPIQNEVREFNKLLSLYSKAKNNVRDLSTPLSAVFSTARNQEVTVQRIAIDASNGVVITARAQSDDAISAFRQRLSENVLFRDITLPLASISRSDVGISFQVRMRIAR